MSHTLPDYTTKYKLAKIFGNVDNAELGARINGLSTMDRRGNVIWWDDFEGGASIKWGVSADGLGTATVSATKSWMGSQSMKTVTDAALGSVTYLDKSFSLPLERRLGVEFMFRIESGKPSVLIYWVGFTGTESFMAQVYYDFNLDKLYYQDAAWAWIELTKVDGTVFTHQAWCFMKLVIDWTAKEYVRFIFGASEYDLSGIPLRSGASATKRRTDVNIWNRCETAAAATVYFDNFILTQNEP
jgi:hypothetical protein